MEIGSVVVRYMTIINAFHFGIVVEIEPEIKIIEFNYPNTLRKINMEEFIHDQKYYWIADLPYKDRMRSPQSSANVAQHLLNNPKKLGAYDVVFNNCERFVYICKYKDQTLWQSKQIMDLILCDEVDFTKFLMNNVSNLINNKKRKFKEYPYPGKKYTFIKS